MQEKPFDINSLSVASPCSVGWETMTGDERVRHCNSCQLNIYNTAEMTAGEVEQLIGHREGRRCIRLRRRPDGTVITKDCPIGFRDYQKRLARSVGATLSLILGLVWTGFAQKSDPIGTQPTQLPQLISVDGAKETRLLVKILDPNGALVPGAELLLFRDKKKKGLRGKTNEVGECSFVGLTAGFYSIEAKFPGFKTTIHKNIKLVDGFVSEVSVVIHVADGPVVVGLFADEVGVDRTSSTVQKTLPHGKISLIPHE